MSGVTHSAGCWQRHHSCAVSRVWDLTAALDATRAAVTAFDRACKDSSGERFSALPVSAEQLDRWHRALELADMDVAGADVTPDPAAPATTT